MNIPLPLYGNFAVHPAAHLFLLQSPTKLFLSLLHANMTCVDFSDTNTFATIYLLRLQGTKLAEFAKS